MERLRLLAFLISLPAALVVGPPALGQPFVPGCILPFHDIQGEDLKIDEKCDVDGDATTPKKTAENQAKNNFCATGQAAPLTFVSFRNLQRKSDQKKAAGVDLAADRDLLKGDFYKTSDGDHVGEGSLVRLA